MLSNFKILPSFTVLSSHETFGDGKPEEKQYSVTFLPSKTTMVSFSIFTNAGTKLSSRQESLAKLQDSPNLSHNRLRPSPSCRLTSG